MLKKIKPPLAIGIFFFVFYIVFYPRFATWEAYAYLLAIEGKVGFEKILANAFMNPEVLKFKNLGIYHPHHPLPHLLWYIAYSLFSPLFSSIFLVAIINAAFTAIGLVYLYKLLEEIYEDKDIHSNILSILFIGFSFVYIYYSTEAASVYTISNSLLIIAIYYLIKKRTILSFSLYALSIGSHVVAIVMLPVFIIQGLKEKRFKDFFIGISSFISILLIIFVFLNIAIVKGISDLNDLIKELTLYTTYGGIIFSFSTAFKISPTGPLKILLDDIVQSKSLLENLIQYLIGISILLSIYRFIKSNARYKWLTLYWLTSFLIYFYIWFFSATDYWLFLFPPIAIIIRNLFYVYTKRTKPAFAYILPAIVLIINMKNGILFFSYGDESKFFYLTSISGLNNIDTMILSRRDIREYWYTIHKKKASPRLFLVQIEPISQENKILKETGFFYEEPKYPEEYLNYLKKEFIKEFGIEKPSKILYIVRKEGFSTYLSFIYGNRIYDAIGKYKNFRGEKALMLFDLDIINNDPPPKMIRALQKLGYKAKKIFGYFPDDRLERKSVSIETMNIIQHNYIAIYEIYK